MAPGEGDTGVVLGENLIPLINRLQDIFSQVTVDLKLSLPQVAVIGSQSSGKSSVLEALVGRDFLPRGSDIVTRRPLVLQLVKTQASGGGKEKDKEWGEFLHAPGKLYYEFDQIRAEIQAETDRVVGHNKNVSDKPIRLKIFSPNVLTMTLVDLPGMTRVPVGDQPSNIEHKIREMVLEYIRQPSCIILAVTPANQDLANSDALHLARMVDPEGVKTIGVLTKLDIMDRGTNAAYILRNTHIPLRLGYVGVVLRSQEDINKNAPMSEAKKFESKFFASSADYHDVASQCGISNLARRLNAILVEHIRLLLPGLRRRIQDLLEQRAAELKVLGDASNLQSKSARGAFLLQLLCDYSERLGAMLDGRHVELTTRQLSGGARVRHVFQELLGRSLRELQPVRGISDEEICTVIKNGAGVTGNLLVPQEPFELLVRRAIAQLLPPALHCKEAVHEELLRIAEQACPRDAARFPALQRALAHAVMDYIRSGADPAERMIRHLVDCELDYINCDHPEFIGGRGAIRAVMQERSVRAAGAGAVAGAGGKPPGAGGKGDGSDAHSGPKDGACGSALSVRKGTASGGSMTGGSGSEGASAAAATLARNSGAVAPGSGGPPLGLKGLPEASPAHRERVEDIFLGGQRTRRHSNDGYPSHSNSFDAHTWHSGNGNTGASGGSASSATGAHHHSNSAAGGSSGSWFSWFGRAEQPVQTQQAGPLPGIIPRESPRGLLGGLLRTEQEELEVEVIRKLVDSYFCIVRKTLLDQVPKAIMHFMVNNTKRGMQQHLIQQLYRDDVLDELLAEREEVVAQRKACSEAVRALQEAVKALEEVPGELTSASIVGGGHGQPLLLPGSGGGPALSLASGGHFSGGHAYALESVTAAFSAPLLIERSNTMQVAARVATMASYSLQSDSMAPPHATTA